MTVTQREKQAAPSPSYTPVRRGLLQRACACGSHTVAGGECEACRKQHTGLLQRTAVSAPDDAYEQEANRVADRVIAAPAPHSAGAAPLRVQRLAGQPTGQTATAPASVDQALAGPGKPLEPGLRQDMEQRFGHDFSAVRVHVGGAAEQSARDVHAHAYTLGRNIAFGAGQFAPSTAAGRRLLAHELTHVVQQSGGGALAPVPQALQRQPVLGGQSQAIPSELQTSADVGSMSEAELIARHDEILAVLAGFTMSTPDTALLEREAARIGVELGRRQALAAGRTFTEESITKMKEYFVANARKPARPRENPPAPPAGGWQDSCIVALNKGMKIVTTKPNLPTTPETIEKTMEKIAASGHSGVAREVWFETKAGKITRGGARPEKLQTSIWDTVIALSGGDPGWSVFTMSIDDGNHSVTLTLDANDPSAPRVYWSDQWSSKGGWKAYTRSELDAEVTRLVKMWWDEQAEGRKFKPVVRVWRVRATPATGGTP